MADHLADCMALPSGRHCYCEFIIWSWQIELRRRAFMARNSLCVLGALRCMGPDRHMATGVPQIHESAVKALELARPAGLRCLHHPSTGIGRRDSAAARMERPSPAQVRRRGCTRMHSLLAGRRSAGTSTRGAPCCVVLQPAIGNRKRLANTFLENQTTALNQTYI